MADPSDETMYPGDVEPEAPQTLTPEGSVNAQEYCVTVYSAGGGAVIGRETITAGSDQEAAYKGYRVMKKYCPLRCPYGVRRGAC